MSELRELAKEFREGADILEELDDIQENDTLDSEEKQEKKELLLAKLFVKMAKINSISG